MYLNNNLNDKKETYIFIDISNITIGFYNYIIHNYKKYKICNPKIDYNNLFKIIEKEKNIKKKIIIGSEICNLLKDVDIKKKFKILYLDNYVEKLIL